MHGTCGYDRLCFQKNLHVLRITGWNNIMRYRFHTTLPLFGHYFRQLVNMLGKNMVPSKRGPLFQHCSFQLEFMRHLKILKKKKWTACSRQSFIFCPLLVQENYVPHPDIAHPFGNPPFANYERNPIIACWLRFRGVFQFGVLKQH